MSEKPVKKKSMKDIIAKLEEDLSVAKVEGNIRKINAIMKMINYLKNKK